MKKVHIDFHSAGTFINVVVICLAMAMAFTVIAQEYNTSSVSLSVDNDGLLGSDRGYTNGVFLKFNSTSSSDIEKSFPFPFKTIASRLPLNLQTNKGWGITAGQQIWTPNNLTSLVEAKNDRPYAGFLFIKANVVEFSADTANKYSLMLGTVGPDALGDKSQQYIHRLIGSKEPTGWRRQIDDQVVFNLSYETQRLLTRSKAWSDNDYETGFTSRINLGNYQSEVALGGTIRWGNALHESFGSVGITPGNYIDPSVLSKSKTGQFYYLALEARYRFQDITIEGSRPEHFFDVHTEHWQATMSLGTVYYQKSWGVALSIITSTSDYKEDLRNYNAIASIELFWRV